MAFLLQPRTQSQEGTQRDSRVSVARAPAAPGRPFHFLCLFLLEPASPPLTPPCVSTASCSQPLVPTTPSLGPFLGNCLSSLPDPGSLDAFVLDYLSGLRHVIWPMSCLHFSVKEGRLLSVRRASLGQDCSDSPAPAGVTMCKQC